MVSTSTRCSKHLLHIWSQHLPGVLSISYTYGLNIYQVFYASPTHMVSTSARCSKHLLHIWSQHLPGVLSISYTYGLNIYQVF
ncbi:unnamed protein product [Danaus chrysippus]|uniref:(African queen) hypothetical protein n=1 Tax=Danaus chrysippus TaxID=151541 RepID=A0A8J2QDQ3_9NEOP|nr:unnamed protein product [Danaus chrysippus]